MNEQTRAMVMVIGPKEQLVVPDYLQGCFWQMESGQQALEIMRIYNIDLFLVCMHVPDINTWELVRKVKMRHSDVKWALLCRDPSPSQERLARTLGVLRIFYTVPDVASLYNFALLIRKKVSAEVTYNKNLSKK